MLIFVTILYTIATCFLAYYAYKNYEAAQIDRNAAEQSRSQSFEAAEEFRRTLRDLYEAIVIATLLSGPSSYGSYDTCRNTFESEYKGDIKIFKERPDKAS